MAELDHLEDLYLKTRSDTDLWQASQLAHESGVVKLEATIPAKPSPDMNAGNTRSEEELKAMGLSYDQIGTRKTKTVELPEVQAIRQQYKEAVGKIATGEAALEEVGKAGRKVAEAVAPGVEVAGRAMGLDEEGAAALARGFTEFIAGLPGQNESDMAAGVETALAALPMVGTVFKSGKIVTKAASSDRYGQWFEQAILRMRQEDAGQAVLDHLDETGKSPHQVVNEFWSRTYPDLPDVVKARFHNMIKRETGFEPGSTIAVDKEGKSIIGKDWPDLYSVASGDVPSSVEQLEGTQRGMIALMEMANQRRQIPGQHLAITDEFQKAVDILKSERGSVSLGGKGKEKLPGGGVETPVTWDEAVKIDEYQRAFDERLKTFSERLSTQRRGVRSDVQVTSESRSPDAIQTEAFLNLAPGTILKDSDVVAAKRMFKDLAEPTRKLAQWVAANPRDEQAFLALLQRLPQVNEGVNKIAGVYAESGRTQRLLSKDRPTPGKPPLGASTTKRIGKLNVEREQGVKRRIARLEAELRGADEEHAFYLREAIDQQKEALVTKEVPPVDVLAEFQHEAEAELREISRSIDEAFAQDVDRAISGSTDDELSAVSVAFPKDTDSHIISKVSGLLDELRTIRIEKAIAKLSSREPVPEPERIRISDPYIQQWLEFFKQQDELAKMGAPALTREKLIETLAGMTTPEEFIAAAKVLSKPSKWDMFIEYWINGLLSGPATHATNIISNAATIAWGIPERQLAAMYSKEVRPSEAVAMLGGILEAQGDAWRLAWQAFKAEESQIGTGKLEGPARAITADALELTGVPGRAVDFLGSMIRLPGRSLLAADDYFKSIAMRAELRALAKRESFRAVTESNLTGQAARNKMREMEERILANPPEDIEQAAKEYAAYVTFTRDLGEVGQKVQALANTPVGRLVLPFVRTPTNIFKFAGERTPLAFASNAVREEITAGGSRRALALAKISLGAMTMGYIGSLAAEGIVTGGGPKDKQLRQELMMTGWQPYSFKIGNTYYSYARIEPLGSLFGMAADAADLIGQLPQQEAEKLGAALVVAISRNMANKTFIKGLSGTLNAVASQDIGIVKSFLEKELPTILPYSTGMSQLTREIDPVMREVNSILDAFKKRVPGYSDTLPPTRNLWGEPILLQGGLGPDMISPIYTSTMKLDPVAEELVRLELPVGMPGKMIEGVPLTGPDGPWEYDALVVLQGAKPIIGEMTLKERLAETMHSELYKQASGGKDGGKKVLIMQVVSAYRDMAQHILTDPELTRHWLGREFPDLVDAIQGAREKQAQKFNAPALAR